MLQLSRREADIVISLERPVRDTVVTSRLTEVQGLIRIGARAPSFRWSATSSPTAAAASIERLVSASVGSWQYSPRGCRAEALTTATSTCSSASCARVSGPPKERVGAW